jgi:hypothetical protein
MKGDDGGMPLIRVRFEEAVVRPREFEEQAKLSPVPAGDLTDFIKQEKARLGKIPAKNSLVARAKAQFPQYHVTRERILRI